MNISKLYEDQRARAMATFPDIVSEARVLRFDSGEPLKLRIEIIDGSIMDIFYATIFIATATHTSSTTP